MRLVPVPVIEGFTLGIAVIIGVQQVPARARGSPPAGEGVVLGAAGAVVEWLATPATGRSLRAGRWPPR